MSSNLDKQDLFDMTSIGILPLPFPTQNLRTVSSHNILTDKQYLFNFKSTKLSRSTSENISIKKNHKNNKNNLQLPPGGMIDTTNIISHINPTAILLCMEDWFNQNGIICEVNQNKFKIKCTTKYRDVGSMYAHEFHNCTKLLNLDEILDVDKLAISVQKICTSYQKITFMVD